MENKKIIFFIFKILIINTILIVIQTPKSYGARQVNIQYATVALSNYTYVYNGQAKKPAVKSVKVSGKNLSSSNYTVRYLDNVNAGQAKVAIAGKGKYTGIKYINFTIKQRNISNYNGQNLFKSQTYDGKKKTPGCTIKIDNRYLSKNNDYSIKYSNNINAGKATVTITGKGNYTGSFKSSFNINKRNLANCKIQSIGEKTYDGRPQKRYNFLFIDGREANEGKDYDISYRDNINVGTAKVTVVGKGNYTGRFDTTFQIVQKDISEWVRVWNLSTYSYTYSGQECRPNMKSKAPDGNYLRSGVDYTITYKNNINEGEAEAIITGINNYKGKLVKYFSIEKRDISSCDGDLSKTQYVYDGQKKEPDIVIKVNNKKLVKNVDYQLKYKDNIKVGTATVEVAGKGNYEGKFTKNFKIVSKDLSSFSATLNKTSYEYNGSALKPTATVKQNNKILKANTDYKITYSNNNKVGTATASIQGIGNYTGKILRTFIITRKKTNAERIIEKAEEIKDYMAENKYDYCLNGYGCRKHDERGEDYDSHKKNTKCGLCETFNESKKAGCENVCCATYVSWVLREAGIINFTNHNAMGLSDNLLATGKFVEVTEGIKKGEYLDLNTKALRPGDIIAYDGGGHIEIAASANTVYSAGDRATEIWIKGPTHRRDPIHNPVEDKPNIFNRKIYRVLRIKE